MRSINANTAHLFAFGSWVPPLGCPAEAPLCGPLFSAWREKSSRQPTHSSTSPKPLRSRAVSRKFASAAPARQAGTPARAAHRAACFSTSLFLKCPPQGGGRAGREIQQVDASGLALVHARRQGEPQDQQGAAPHPKAGEHPGSQARQGRKEEAHNASTAPHPAVEKQRPKASAQPSHRDFGEHPPGQESAGKAPQQVGPGGGKVYRAPAQVHPRRYQRQGQHHRHRGGEGPALVHPRPAGEQGHQKQPAPPRRTARCTVLPRPRTQ